VRSVRTHTTHTHTHTHTHHTHTYTTHLHTHHARTHTHTYTHLHTHPHTPRTHTPTHTTHTHAPTHTTRTPTYTHHTHTPHTHTPHTHAHTHLHTPPTHTPRARTHTHTTYTYTRRTHTHEYVFYISIDTASHRCELLWKIRVTNYSSQPEHQQRTYFLQKVQQHATVYQSSIIPYLNEAQHVSGDSPPIIRSLKLHTQPLVLHAWKVVGRVVVGRSQVAYVRLLCYVPFTSCY
jgi:hypothetical protein